MFHIQYINNSDGSTLQGVSINTLGVYVTQGIDISRNTEGGAIGAVITGTMGAVTKQYSWDNINFYNAYDMLGTDISQVADIKNSRIVSLYNTDTSDVMAPYMRLKFSGTGVITGITSLIYMQKEY